MSIFTKFFRRPLVPAHGYVSGFIGEFKAKTFKLGNGFDWSKATVTPFGSSYFGDDTLTFSLGEKDWMPIGIAMAAMLPDWEKTGDPLQEAGQLVLRRFLFQHLWLMPSDRRFDAWLESNRAPIARVQAYEPYKRQEGLTAPEDLPFDDSLDAGSETLAEWYISAVERYRPPSAERRTVLCDGYDYSINQTVEAARASAKEALDVTERLALAWFEVRGAKVNLERKLVQMEGYRPLTACDEFHW
jgi:hypothetical protein